MEGKGAARKDGGAPGVTVGQRAKTDKQKRQQGGAAAGASIAALLPAGRQAAAAAAVLAADGVFVLEQHVAEAVDAAQHFLRGHESTGKQRLEAVHAREPSHASCLWLARVAITQAVGAFLKVRESSSSCCGFAGG